MVTRERCPNRVYQADTSASCFSTPDNLMLNCKVGSGMCGTTSMNINQLWTGTAEPTAAQQTSWRWGAPAQCVRKEHKDFPPLSSYEILKCVCGDEPSIPGIKVLKTFKRYATIIESVEQVMKVLFYCQSIPQHRMQSLVFQLLLSGESLQMWVTYLHSWKSPCQTGNLLGLMINQSNIWKEKKCKTLKKAAVSNLTDNVVFYRIHMICQIDSPWVFINTE